MGTSESNEAKNARTRSGHADVLISLPLPATGAGVSYTCMSISRNVGPALQINIVTPYGKKKIEDPFRLTRTLPAPLRLLPFRKVQALAVKRNEAGFLSAAKHAKAKPGKTIAYIWPDPSIQLLRQLRDAGLTIVREMINCHRGTAKPILDSEYKRLGLPAQHTISAASVEFESEALSYSDYVLCSNPLAEKSVIDHGVPASKVRPVSFGWDPERFRGETRALPSIDGPTFIFVGLICVRKGAHLILRYWARSGIRGRLVMVGKVEPAIAQSCAEYFARDDVTLVNYSPRIGEYYRSADAFVFPTLEEGGPQVTYEAAGCRLPLVTTPMGAARMADDSTGYVLDPFDEEGWIAAMRSLADDAELRRRMGAIARSKAMGFTWEEVGKARGRILGDIAGVALAPATARAAHISAVGASDRLAEAPTVARNRGAI